MSDPFRFTTLGRTGLPVCRLGIAASYGVPTAGVERAFEAGVNYFFWGSRRTGAFGQALRNLAGQRDRIVLLVETYTRMASLMEWSLQRALRSARTGHADVLLLGLWNRPVPERILDAARRLRDRGLVRFLALSTHKRSLVPQLAGNPDIPIFHVRYNAVHPGAEKDIFPLLPKENRPGLVAFTATSWGQLMSRRRVPESERVPTATDAYRFVLSNPCVDVCITGPKTLAHVDQALDALRLGPLADEEMAWIRRVGRAIYGR